MSSSVRLPNGRKTPTRLRGSAFTDAMAVLEFATNFSKGLPAADDVKSLSIEKLEVCESMCMGERERERKVGVHTHTDTNTRTRARAQQCCTRVAACCTCRGVSFPDFSLSLSVVPCAGACARQHGSIAQHSGACGATHCAV